MADRNPILIPKAAVSGRACRACGSTKWYGRNIQGAITFKCECGFTWQGGLPQLPQDPSIPVPPDRYEPTVKFVENKRAEGGVEEIRRKPDTTADFRKGALITPEDGDQ
jgi:hypothetical protein